MKAYVLMNRKTGDLFEGHKVTFMDQEWVKENDLKDFGYQIQLGVFQHDGWIVYHPEMSPAPLFFNRTCEKWFKVLGDL